MADFPIPTGLRHSAQGCARRATLGHAHPLFPQAQRGCSFPGGCNPVGVEATLSGVPRVVPPTGQPWARRRYPVGVNRLPQSNPRVQLVTNCYQLKTARLSITQSVANCHRVKNNEIHVISSRHHEKRPRCF
jgi:hypothetical protein